MDKKTLIEWKEEYSVGIEEIDDQHQHMVGIINDLFYIINNKEFDKVYKKLDVIDNRLDNIDDKLGKIEKVILSDHRSRIERLEIELFNLKNSLAAN